ncbi:transmembrane protein [Thraustotheca clavata]|uniref:Transmembrane protein n=1 Tax=Thraustotheca clavata TaxID=74557 RepID=A0A1V9ZUZ8_9STRA|nr:transmembrane protein [Thraustotheca clavata]
MGQSEDHQILLDKQEPASNNDSYENGVPNLLHRNHIGLMINYALIGLLMGTFPRTIFPFFRMYLNMDGYQVSAAKSLIGIAWSFKIVVGVLSDSVSIAGYRRRPYMLSGWLLCLVFLSAMAWTNPEPPYFAKGEILAQSNASLRKILNPNAQFDGISYLLLLMGATVGYVMVDVACDAVMVELAQTEREDVRGHTQTLSYITKSIFASIGSAVVGLTMNGEEYGGAFTWSVSFNGLMLVYSIVVLVIMPCIAFVPDNLPLQMPSLGTKCKELYELCKQRAMWQVMWFQYLNTLFFEFEAAPASVVQSEWAHVHPFNEAMFSIVSCWLLACGMYITKRYFLHVDWRWLTAITTLFVVVVDSTVSFLTIFDYVRNQWFYLGGPVLGHIPEGVRYIVTGFVIVEIADAGHEGATYGLLTTVGNLASPFAVALSKVVDAPFHVFQEDVVSDTSAVRVRVAWTFGIMYFMKLLSIITLVLLPSQKVAARALRRDGGAHPRMAFTTLSTAALSLLFGIVTNLLSIFPATACLVLAGGEGCSNSTTH